MFLHVKEENQVLTFRPVGETEEKLQFPISEGCKVSWASSCVCAGVKLQQPSFTSAKFQKVRLQESSSQLLAEWLLFR